MADQEDKGTGQETGAGAGTSGAANTGGTKEVSGVPYARFAEVIEERNAARAEAARVKAEADGAKSEVESLRGEVEWGKNRLHLAKEGVYDEDIHEFVRHAYGNAKDDKGGKPAFNDWLTSFREAKPHLFGAAGQEQSRQAQTQGQSTSTNRGVQPGAGASHAYTPEELRTMDRETYKKHREAIKAALQKRR